MGNTPWRLAVGTACVVALAAGAGHSQGHAAARPARAAATAGPLAPLRGLVVGIDPGHNGANGSHPTQIDRLVNAGTFRKACDTTGTDAPGGYTESAFNFDVATRLEKILRAAGATVVATRTNDHGVGPCVNQRAAITNRAQFAVSIHADGNLAAGARGFHVEYAPAIGGLISGALAARNRELAIDIRDAVHSATGMPLANYLGTDGLYSRTDLGGLNLSHVPKVLIESGNMKNRTDDADLESPTWREREARGLALGLARFATLTHLRPR